MTRIIQIEDNSEEKLTLSESDRKDRCDKLDKLISKRTENQQCTEKLRFIKNVVMSTPKPFPLVFPEPGVQSENFLDRFEKICTAMEYIEKLTCGRKNEEHVITVVALLTTVLVEGITQCTGTHRDRKRARHMMEQITQKRGPLPRTTTWVQHQFIDTDKKITSNCSKEIDAINRVLGTHDMVIPTVNNPAVNDSTMATTPTRLSVPGKLTLDCSTTKSSHDAPLEIDTQKETAIILAEDEVDDDVYSDNDELFKNRKYSVGVRELASITGTGHNPHMWTILQHSHIPAATDEEHCKEICDLGFKNNRYLSARWTDVFNPDYIDDEQTAIERRQAWMNKGYEKQPTYDVEYGWHCTETFKVGDEKQEKDNKEDEDEDDQEDREDKRNGKRTRDQLSSPSRNTRSQTASPGKGRRSGAQHKISRRSADFLGQFNFGFVKPIVTN